MSGVQMLDALGRFARRYVVVSGAQRIAVALWIAHTHALAAAEQSPYLMITSPEKRSGKTRLLDVLELVVANPWRVIMPSEAVTFRKLDGDRPTLLLDEVDAIFNLKAGANTEGLRAILNAGNRPGTMVPRCVGASQQLVGFAVFSPKALAGLRELPDTVSDRSVPIRLKRKSPSEHVERFRVREVGEQARPIYDWVASWAEAHLGELAEARPALPPELDDRAQDAWEPLFAIADLASGEWPELARHAALALSGPDARSDESEGVHLLADIRAIFDEQAADRLASSSLVTELHAIEESPWGEWRGGKSLSAHGVARLLRQFEIRPRSVRLDDETTAKGYLLAQFEDAFARYLPQKTSKRHNPHG